MSTGYRPTEADLIAIYRLEFYRKQKNWKLSPDKRRDVAQSKAKKTESAASKSTLNETYDVDDMDMEVSPLNEAFVESSSDKNSQAPDSPKEMKELKTVRLYKRKTPVPPNIFQNSPHPEKDQNVPENLMVPELQTNTQVWSGCNSQKQWFTDQAWQEMAKGSGPEPAWSNPEPVWSKPEPVWSNPEPGWSNPEPVWSNPEPGWSNPEPVWSDPNLFGVEREPVEELWSNLADNCCETDFTKEGIEQLGGNCTGGLWAAAEERCRAGAAADGAPCGRGDDGDTLSQDSLSEFTRGAHCAPHSSELELILPAGPTNDMSLAHMSNSALRWNINNHMHALRALIKEAQLRDELSSAPSYDSLELPTRDVGLPADFLAGSYRGAGAGAVADGPGTGDAPVGRGRGRLRARTQPLIGIGGGRPFRL